MSTMEFVSNLVSDVISLLWLIFLSWIIWHFRKEISSFFEILKDRISKVKLGKLIEIEISQEEQAITVSGLLKTIEQGLRSENTKERSRIAEEDLPKLGQILSPGDQVMGPIESEAIRKLRIICDDSKDPNAWIPDHIFVSATYGYGVGPVELSIMRREGWIEVSGNKVRVTEKGRRFIESS